jgi:acetylornithine/succinyldiaminopimelate/putrescine aminotransferase
MATDAVMSTVQPGDHGGTYAGNLLACRAAATVLRVIEEEELVQRSARLGDRVRERLDALARRAPDRLEGVRGLGLLQGLVFRDPAAAAAAHTRTRELGALVSLTAERVLRVFPALNIPEDDLDRGLSALESAATSEAGSL